eukprot:5093481-Prymnesium_polylepis.1
MARVEGLAWFGGWLEGVREARAAREAKYQAMVGERVGWLCVMHPEQKPAQAKVEVPSELLPP